MSNLQCLLQVPITVIVCVRCGECLCCCSVGEEMSAQQRSEGGEQQGVSNGALQGAADELSEAHAHTHVSAANPHRARVLETVYWLAINVMLFYMIRCDV